MENFKKLLNTENVEILGGLVVLCALSSLLISIQRHALSFQNMPWLRFFSIFVSIASNLNWICSKRIFQYQFILHTRITD